MGGRNLPEKFDYPGGVGSEDLKRYDAFCTGLIWALSQALRNLLADSHQWSHKILHSPIHWSGSLPFTWKMISDGSTRCVRRPCTPASQKSEDLLWDVCWLTGRPEGRGLSCKRCPHRSAWVKTACSATIYSRWTVYLGWRVASTRPDHSRIHCMICK